MRFDPARRSLLAITTLCAAVLTPAQHSAAAQTCPDPSTSTAPAGYLSVRDYGAAGNGVSDDTAAIECTITAAVAQAVNVWFPSGRYEVSASIALPAGRTIAGQADSTDPAIIQATTAGLAFGDAAYNSVAGSNLTVQDLFFDSIGLELHGPWQSLVLRRNGFSDSRGFLNWASNGSTELSLLDVKSATVSDSIFLHGAETTDAVPIHLYVNSNVTVARNVVGLDLSQLGWLSSWPGYASWTHGSVTATGKLGRLRTTLALGADQGQFRTGLYAESQTNVTVDSNILAGSAATQGTRDHVAYFWGPGSGSYTRNWAKGWAADASGGVKVRNGSSIKVAANRLIGTGILLYVYDNFVPYSLDHVTVCNNAIDVIGGTAANAYEGIFYWQTTTPTSLSDISIFGNQFTDPSHTGAVSLTNGNVSAFDVFATNTYTDTGATVPLTGNGNPTIDHGTPDSTHLAQCTGLTVPSYPIP
ncbi:glycosyl hydrolase family 28-related protein [Kribbella sp. NPDC051586]|uniref:glycosyl hydrolase family 28-related protein n=1 Tax=Kribbella sp. NPDC051586 TaxID=3364118 RepID=UPI003792C4B7